MDPITGAEGQPVEVGMWRTRFTVRRAPTAIRIIIEPKVVGEHEFGECSANYELLLASDTLTVLKWTVRGTDMVNGPFEEVTKRLPSDPVGWWIAPWRSSVFPRSLVVALPVFTSQSGGALGIPPRTAETTSFRQLVNVRSDGSVAVQLLNARSEDALNGNRLVFPAGAPWYQVENHAGALVNRIVETGVR